MEPEEIGVAIQAFMSESCPNCGGSKEFERDPFCQECYCILSIDLQKRMTSLSEFINAFHPAMTFLRSHSPSHGSGNAKTTRH